MKKITIDNKRQHLVNVLIGQDVKIYDFVNAYGCEVGDGSKIGAFVEIQKGVTIGKHCKIQSHTFICEGVEIKDNVFVGHNVTFINDKHPKVFGKWQLIKTVVEKGASIGSSVTIMAGVKIGKNALVGAGSVVTKDVQANTVVVGNPARILKHL
jgi:acetyltransferase-like isoleucine patch superfamily enzyme